MFPEGGQTRKNCFLAMFPEGGQTTGKPGNKSFFQKKCKQYKHIVSGNVSNSCAKQHCSRHRIILIIVLFVETPRKFITAKLSIHKPGSSSVLIKHYSTIALISTDEDPGLRIESFAVINLRDVSTNKTIIYFIAMQTYKELRIILAKQNRLLMFLGNIFALCPCKEIFYTYRDFQLFLQQLFLVCPWRNAKLACKISTSSI